MGFDRGARSLLVCVLMLPLATQVSAQSFGDFLNALKNATQQPGQPSGSVQVSGTKSQTAQANSPGFGARATERYCKNLFSVASLESRGPVSESLVSEEFNIDPMNFYDEVVKSLDAKPGSTSYAFPSPDFYRGEFETDKIDVIFDLLLSYPSPKYAAALIAEARSTSNQPQYDHQAKVDAIAALAILHFRMQDKSKTPGRWKELVASLKGEDHYVANVIWARLLKSGEMGTTDVGGALQLAVEANGLRNKYSTEGGYRKMSSKNYQIISNQTLYETLLANPNHPQRRNYAQFIQKYESIKNATDPVPELKAQLGPGIAAVEKASKSAAEKANLMLLDAKEAGNINAQKASLVSATRNRVSDSSNVNTDIRTVAALARQLEKVEKLDDNQKKLVGESLSHAHESGDRAISMMGPMMNAVMNIMMQRGIEAMPAILPYAKKLQSYSDGACSVVTRLDHAAMVKNVAVDQDRRSMAVTMNDMLSR